ncbi:MAG: NAD(+) diphosphatase [Dokdonella sp.]
MSAFGRSRANTYSNLSLDREGEFRDRDTDLARRAAAASSRYIVLRKDGRALVDPDSASLRLVSNGESGVAVQHASFLGRHANADYFLSVVDDAASEALALQLDARWLDLRSAGSQLPSFDAGLFAYARALAHWQARTRHCPVCGAMLLLVAAGHRARCTNPDCGADQFPRTDAAVIMIVTHDDACLLGRQASWPERRYSALAGFVEPGETLEDAVCREVFEEAGVIVEDCEYHSSQPWPFPASLMVGFIARAATRAINLGSELQDARWFSPDDIVRKVRNGELLISSSVSVSHRLIEHWLHESAGIDLTELVHESSFHQASSFQAAQAR